MKRTAVVLAVVSILLALSCRVPSHCHNSSQQAVTQGQSKWQTFGGKVVSQNDVRFVLRDYDNDTWYHIDDQQKAASFLGKNVLITGVFDGLTGTIRVQNIVEATPEQISAANTERIKENTPPPPHPRSCRLPGSRRQCAPKVFLRGKSAQQPAAPRLEARSDSSGNEARRPLRAGLKRRSVRRAQ